MIRTVNGTVHGETHDLSKVVVLGVFEHVLVDLAPTANRGETLRQDEIALPLLGEIRANPQSFLWNLKLQNVDEASQAIQQATHDLDPPSGLPLLCDITTEAVGQDLGGLIRVADRSRALVVAGTLPSVASLAQGVDAAKYDLIHRLQFGLAVVGGGEGTKAGAGFIGPVVAGVDDGIMIAALGGAQAETKAPILLLSQDPWASAPPNLTAAMATVEALIQAGASPGAIVLGRLPCSLALLPLYRTLLQRGVILGLTFSGGIFTPCHAYPPPHDEEGAELVAHLCREGFRDQIVLSHGVCCRINLKLYGGVGYSHLIRSVVPRLRRHGLSDIDLASILNGTMIRLLSWYTPPPPVEKEKEYGICSWCKAQFEMIENEYYHKFDFVYCKSKCLREHAKTGWKALDNH